MNIKPSAMASFIFFTSIFILLLPFYLNPTQGAGAGGDLIFEDGYTVSTVFDGDKSTFKVNPHSVLHQSPPSDFFVLLDSVASTFYTLSLPANSNETVIKMLAGTAEHNYKDGALNSARFDRPKSFAVDFNGNVYVADQRNHAIRKISKTGVTTIAGGYTQKAGRTDGPARDASFSDDFELTFIPERCALMISDHGNRLIRQINLKAADCTSHSGSVLGTTSTWLVVLGISLSCLIGLVIGFLVRPYVLPYEGIKFLQPSWTWTHCLMNLERLIVTYCSDIRSVVVKSSIYSLLRKLVLLNLSYLSLMFRPKRRMVESHNTSKKSVSLLDLDGVYSSNSSSIGGSNIVVSPEVDDQLRDLFAFDGGSMLGAVNDDNKVENSVADEHGKIDGMILANLMNFDDEASSGVYSPDSLQCSLGLVKRR